MQMRCRRHVMQQKKEMKRIKKKAMIWLIQLGLLLEFHSTKESTIKR